MNTWKPYKNNILVQPQDKGKIIGETATKYLFGEVLDVGEDVGTFKFLWWRIKRRNRIKKGNTIGFTLWGLTELVEADGSKHYFVQDNADFILGVKKNDN